MTIDLKNRQNNSNQGGIKMAQGQSLEARLGAVRLLLNGLKLNAERMASRGVTAEKVDRMNSLYEQAMELDKEQEVLKAKLKEKTAHLDEIIEEINKLASELRKLVKIEIPQELWREFGIEDQR